MPVQPEAALGEMEKVLTLQVSVSKSPEMWATLTIS